MRASRMLASQASKFLRSDYGPFINGAFVKGSGAPLAVEDPAVSSPFITISTPSTSETLKALTDAQSVFDSGIWSKAPPKMRSRVLRKMGDLLEERVNDYAEIESLQTGRPIRELKAQLGRLPEWLHYFSSLLDTYTHPVVPTTPNIHNYLTRVPLGVCVQIAPFNHPLLIAVKKLAPALAAGNVVIVKPSELTPLTILNFAELSAEAGLPAGVLTVLPGLGSTVGADLCTSTIPRKIDLTGGTDTGKKIGSIAGGNLVHYTAELGGKAPVVVFDDADIESAVNGVCFGAFVASGQTCVSGTRIIVQQSIYEEFLSRLLEKINTRITPLIGSPQNIRSSIGPLVSEAQLKKSIEIMDACAAEGGDIKVECGGKRMTGKSLLDGTDLSKGYFFEPTIVSGVTTESRLWKEEIFGPVICIKPFADSTEAIHLANSCEFGLGCAIWTTSLSRAHEVSSAIDAGVIWINDHHKNSPSSPWGGMKSSGIGRENGVEAFEAYSQTKSVIMNTSSNEENRKNDWFGDRLDVRYG